MCRAVAGGRAKIGCIIGVVITAERDDAVITWMFDVGIAIVEELLLELNARSFGVLKTLLKICSFQRGVAWLDLERLEIVPCALHFLILPISEVLKPTTKGKAKNQ